jgi:hypothetical protein
MKTTILILVCFTLAGCEQVVDNPDWPEYKERMVCSANISIHPDSTRITCNLGKTAPLNQNVDFNATRVNDAQITLTRSADSFTLPYAPTPSFMFWDYFNYALSIPTKSANEFTLQCRWQSLQLQGSLTVPADVRTTLDTLFIMQDPRYPDMYIGTFRIHAMPDFEYDLTLTSPTISGPTINSFNAHDLPPGGKSVDLIIYLKQGLWTYSITAKSNNYRDHYSNNGGDVFGPSGGNPRHNMTGDGFGFLTYDITGPEVAFTVK